MSELLQEAKVISAEMARHRRYLHSHAEVGFDLPQTCAYVQKELENMGYAPQKCGKSGLFCTIGQGEAAFLLRADMDALPISEETAVDFASHNGCMHACGHDMHTAMLLGAAKLLRAHEKEIGGCVKLMFQPAEELLLGAQDMIDAGVLENPRVSAGAMLHVMTGVPLETGRVIVSPPGTGAPAAGMFEIRVQGRGGHGASPEGCIDPVNAAAHIVLALQAVKARELPAQSGAMLTIGAILGGDAPNVIADSVLLRGSIRAYSAQEYERILQRAREIAFLTAQTFGAEATFSVNGNAPTLQNDADMVRFAQEVLPGILGAKGTVDAAQMGGSRSSGSEDFACVSQKIPTVMLALAAGNTKDGYRHGLHHPMTEFDEKALPYGAATLAGLALAYFAEKRA